MEIIGLLAASAAGALFGFAAASLAIREGRFNPRRGRGAHAMQECPALDETQAQAQMERLQRQWEQLFSYDGRKHREGDGE